VLIGRGAESRRIAGLIDDARSGRGGVLVIRGEPGIGKSALLAHAVASAEGMRVLSARGIESEAELPFSALHELLAPVLDRLDGIPGPQAEALAGALALGPAVPGDRLAVAAGTASVLLAAVAEGPLMLVVDDAHWLDSSSAEALLFAARRAQSEGVAVFFSVRDDEQSAVDDAGLPTLTLRGLDPRSARTLLESRAGELAASVAERLVEQTQGNPLALTEIPSELSAAQLAGAEPLPEPLPAGVGMARAFRRRIDQLPAAAARALLVAAAADSEDLDSVRRALSAAGLDTAALEPAEQSGLIETSGGRLTWRHPLVRSAVYHGATASQRRAAHRVSALAFEDAGRRAWHLAAAAEGRDDDVAALLEQAAWDARKRRAHAAAADAFERAAELTNDSEERARRLLDAASDLQIVGRFERAQSALEQAERIAADPILQASIQHLRGTIEMWGGNRVRAHVLLLEAAERLEHVDPARAAAVLIDAALAHQMDGDVPAMMAAARRAESFARRGGVGGSVDVVPLLINSRILAGEARAVRGELHRRLRRYAEADEAGKDLHLPVWLGHALTWLDDYDDARRLFEREVQLARSNGSLGLVPFSLACLAEIDFRVGRWDACYAGASEAVRLAEETAQYNLLSFCLVTLARIEATRGNVRACRTHLKEAVDLADRLGIGSVHVYALSVSGLLELGLGRVDEAVATLERLAALADRLGVVEPGVVQWRPDLVEAYVLAGRTDDARRTLAVLEEQAELTDRLWARAAAERCRGMLDEEFEGAFDRSLDLHDRLPMPFERARTQLRLGARLRRAKQATRAREPLRAALEVFETLGAVPWARQARTELAATGERRRRPAEATPRELTPQELSIALLVAEGATNREAAAALFLSPKTVGYHLGKVYEKLGINSRAQLAALVARTATAPTDLPRVPAEASVRASRNGPAPVTPRSPIPDSSADRRGGQ
jgi:DNA-binding CsgD family transcriptional regulator